MDGWRSASAWRARTIFSQPCWQNKQALVRACSPKLLASMRVRCDLSWMRSLRTCFGFWYGWPVGQWCTAQAHFLGQWGKGNSCPCQDGRIFCNHVCSVVRSPQAVAVASILHVE